METPGRDNAASNQNMPDSREKGAKWQASGDTVRKS